MSGQAGNIVHMTAWLHFAALSDNDILHGPICILCTHLLNLAHDVHSIDDFAKDDVFAIEMRSRSERDEKLTAVCIWSRILSISASVMF